MPDTGPGDRPAATGLRATKTGRSDDELRREPSVVVVVPTYRRPHLLPRLVAALEAQTLPPDRFEVVIVDDCSGDETMEVLRRLEAATPLRLRAMQNPINSGPASARNAAWRSSEADFAAFTDDDCLPEPQWLEAGIDALADQQGVGILQGRTERPVESSDYLWTAWTLERRITGPTPWFEGCNLFVRRAALIDSGGFDEVLGFFGEETSMAWNILAHGWARDFATDAVVRHDLEERGLRWYAQDRFKEGRIAYIASRYPDIASEFWRPWAVERKGALHALSVISLLLARRNPAALLGTIPYLVDRAPPLRHPFFLQLLTKDVVLDTVRLAGMIIGSVRWRRFVI